MTVVLCHGCGSVTELLGKVKTVISGNECRGSIKRRKHSGLVAESRISGHGVESKTTWFQIIG